MLPQFQSGFSGIKSGLFAPLIALILLLAGTHEVRAQITKIRGKVTDAATGEALPFVNVYFKGTTTGSTTDEQGYYSIETRHAADSLAASSVGYLTRVKPVIRNRFQEINFNLQPDQISLSEVVIKAGENPAEILLRKVIENKPLNDRENLEYYQFEAYTKIGFDANNLSEKFMNRKILKPFAFIFDYIDTSSYTGKAYLPVFLSESLSDVYYRNTPRTRREVIKASRVSGIDNASISQLLGDMIQRLSVAAVRDCGLLPCRNTPKFERDRMLKLPLKPLLLLHFVTNRPSFFSSDIPLIFSVCFVIPLQSAGLCVCKVLIFKEREDFLFFLRVEESILFCKLWFVSGLVRLANVYALCVGILRLINCLKS